MRGKAGRQELEEKKEEEDSDWDLLQGEAQRRGSPTWLPLAPLSGYLVSLWDSCPHPCGGHLPPHNPPALHFGGAAVPRLEVLHLGYN